jgi:hypothetical protein
VTTKHYVDEIGTTIIVDAKTDISTATLIQLRVKKPDGNVFYWAAVLNGLTRAQYTLQPGDFDQAGVYYIQLYVEMPAWQGLGETAPQEVFEAFL